MSRDSSGGKRTIEGFKTFGEKAGKFVLKGGSHMLELAGRGGTRVVGGLLKSDSFKTILTAAGMIGVGIACPTIGLGLLAVVGAKWAANKIMGKDKDENGQTKVGLLDAIKDTIMAGKKLTDKVCEKTEPLVNKAHDWIQETGENNREAIDGWGSHDKNDDDGPEWGD